MISCQKMYTLDNSADTGGANVVRRSNLLSVLGKLVIWRSSSSAARHKAPSTPPHSLASLQPPSQPPQPDPCEYLRGFLGVGKKLSLVDDACTGLEFNMCVRTSAVALLRACDMRYVYIGKIYFWSAVALVPLRAYEKRSACICVCGDPA
jgi:hypothetical protein